MIYPNADKLENWGSKYSLVILAAKRAKQLKQGAKPLIRTDSVNALTVALEEIAAEAISCSVPDNDLPLVAQEEQEASQLLQPIPEPTVGLDREDADAELGETVLVGDDEGDTASASDDEAQDEDGALQDDDELTLGDGDDEEEDEADEDEEEADHDEDSDADVALLAEELQPKPRRRGRKAALLDVTSTSEVLESEAVFDEPVEDLGKDTED